MENNEDIRNFADDNPGKRDKKRLPWVVILLCVLALAVIVVALVFTVNKKQSTEGKQYLEEIIEQHLDPPADIKEGEDIPNPIDFDKLKLLNTDIYAWLDVPGTVISYPVLQHPKDDSYYITHSYDGSSSYYGAIFSQAIYNKNDFSDSATVLYGHNMRNGTMFATLSQYTNEEYFKEHNIFYIYMPDKVLKYQVFAAIPFDNRNILHSWDCTQRNQYWNLVQTILNTRSMDSYIDREIDVNMYDKIVILSSCYPGDSSRRYLVIGKLM